MADKSRQTAAERTPETLETGTRTEHPSRGSGEVTTSFHDGQEKGYHGEKVDPAPNEDYTAASAKTNPPKQTGPDLK